MIINKQHFRILVLPLVLIFLSGCLAIKDTGMARFYQNMTARYNIYFNAKQHYFKMVESTEESYPDEYSGILHIYRFPDEKMAKSNAGSADIIISKCTKILDNKKLSNWTDNSYFLIARAYFYKGEHYNAIELFQYLQNEYPNTDIAYESLLWLSRSQFMLEKYDEARALLSLIKSDNAFPSRLSKDVLLTDAFYNIHQRDYISAKNNLKKAIPQEKDNTNKTRYMFILAQLYYHTGNYDEAIDLYRKVVKRNPPYDMAFNAQIEIPRCFQFDNERDARPVKNMLYKMLKDDKNIQYQDQIYFELALIDLKLGNIAKAEEYFKESIRLNKGNDNQKAIAFMHLGEYYFSRADYPKAKNYYDSTSIFLTPSYPGYKELIATTNTLNELLKNIVLADTEDSLQYMATVSEKSRDSIIEIAFQYDQRLKMEAEMAERELRMQEEQEMRRSRDMMQGQQMGGFMAPPGMGGGLTTSAKWYFYNQSTLDLGKSEFMVRWGKRRLEDDWRRSKKTSSSLVEEGGFDEEEEDDGIAILSEEEQKFIDETLKKIPPQKQPYYANIPFTESQMEASRRREAEARKKTGDIYLEFFKDTNNAIAAYEMLLKRFPDNRHAVQVHYTLYTLYIIKNASDKKQHHKDSILLKYPTSDYALLIQDPNYFKNLIETKSTEINELYEQTYKSFMANNCREVFESVERSNKLYPGNHRRAYFEYLRVLCRGKNSSPEDFIGLLNQFQQRYKNAELTAHSSNLIAYLSGDIISPDDESGSSILKTVDSFLIKSPFSINDQIPHYFIYFFDGRKTNTNAIKSEFSEYNTEYYRFENLVINTLSLGGDNELLVVQQFKNKADAQKYLRGLLGDEKFLERIKNRRPEAVVISEENLPYLIQDKLKNEYMEFYKRYYQ